MNLRAMAVLTAAVLLWGCSDSAKPSEKPLMAKESGSGFYSEESFKGRLYVFGTEEAHQKFKESQQVPHIAKSFIGAGPEGQTVVLEAEQKSDELQNRLRAQYEARHGAKLP